MSRRLVAWSLMACLMAIGCGGGSSNPPDGSMSDGSRDAQAGSDTKDAANDSLPDAVADAPSDGGLDASLDNGGPADGSGDRPDGAQGMDGNDAHETAGDVPTGQAAVIVSTSSLDFGLSACGAVGVSKSLTVQNLGAGSFMISATLAKGAGSPFTVDAPVTTVQSGQTATLTITPKAIPAMVASLPGEFGDMLTIQTTETGDVSHTVTLKQGAQGAIISFDTSSIPFGNIPVSASQSSMFKVINNGNAVAHATLSSSAGAFTVTPNTATMIGASGNIGATATFAPTSTTPQSGAISVAVNAADALCQPLPAAITVTGTGQNGGVSLSPTSLDFGRVSCGSQAAALTFQLTNSGNAPLNYDPPSLGKTPSPYAIAPSTGGALTAGQSVTFTVTPAAIPQTSSVQADFYADTITFTTNVIGDTAHVVNLHMTAQGSILSFNPTQVDFGNVPVTQSQSETFQIVNGGNLAAHVSLASDNSAFMVPAPATTAQPSASTMVSASFSPGTSTAAQSANVTMAVAQGDVLCSPLPSSPLTMTGTGTNGSVAYSPSSVDFGLVNCGTQAAAQKITFTNTGNQSYTVSASLTKGAQSPYTIVINPANGVVPAATVAGPGTAMITVTPAAIPAVSNAPGDYGDTLTVTTTVNGDSPHPIAITEGAKGVILALTPTSILFPNTPVGAQSLFSLAVTNSGNDAATINFTNIGNSVFTFDQGQVAQGGVSINPNAYFTPAAVQGYAATAVMAVPNGTVLCAPLPNTQINLTGTGSAVSTASVTPTTLNFGHVPCGVAATSKIVRLSNSGVGSFTWTATTGTNYYAISGNAGTTGASGTLAAGSSINITVQPLTIPISATTSVAFDFYGDVLTISTSAPNDSPHTVTLSETATGAILTFQPPSVVVNHMAGSKTANFQVRNADGYQAAAVTLTLNNTSAANLSLSPTTGSTINGTPMAATITNLGALSGSANVSVSTSSPICAPLPQALQVTAN